MTHVTVNGVYKGSVANNLMGIMAEGGQPVEITTIVNRGEGFSYKVIWVVNDVQTDVTEQMTVPAEEGFIFTPYLNESTVADIYKIVISANDNPNIQDIITVTVPAGGSKVQAQTPAETPQQVNAQTQPSTVPADYTTTP